MRVQRAKFGVRGLAPRMFEMTASFKSLACVQTLLLLRNLRAKGKVCSFTPTFLFQR